MAARETVLVPPPLHPGQAGVWADRTRFQVLACGRRWGKTRLGVLRCVRAAVDGGAAWWVAPSFPTASIGWRLIKRLLAQVPGAEPPRETERLAILPGGGWVQVKSADNPDSLRGEGLDLVVIDECAFVREAAWTEALRAALSDRRGRAVFVSTPAGRNWFWRLWRRGQEPDGEWRSWQFPTRANPFIAPAEIEAARALLPERVFAQEYLAHFLEDGAGVFRRVLEAATADLQPAAVEGHAYVMGVDLARRRDFTVCVVFDQTEAAVAAVDRFNQIDWRVQRGRIAALVDRFRAEQLLVDETGVGDPVVQELRREVPVSVIGYQFTHASKAVAIEALALAFEQGRLRIPAPGASPEAAALLGELEAYDSERLPSGLVRYGAPEGAFDDCVIALALAWQAAQGTESGYGEVIPSAPLRINPGFDY